MGRVLEMFLFPLPRRWAGVQRKGCLRQWVVQTPV